ncbi:MAG TPA: TMEM175 family protein [Steroidobacteraceae bacterium]|jgi:uncharacterized membrane protein
MGTGRLEAFSDGVIAIIITIMVLELKAPIGSGFDSLLPVIPTLLSYVLSFMYVGIYWTNHHHMLQVCEKVSGAALWANLHLLFWLSLIPFATAWVDENHNVPAPVALYGAVLLMAAVAYYILARVLIRDNGPRSALATAFGKDFKGAVSIVLYLIGITLSLWHAWLGLSMYVLVAIMWVIPDRRIERK